MYVILGSAGVWKRDHSGLVLLCIIGTTDLVEETGGSVHLCQSHRTLQAVRQPLFPSLLPLDIRLQFSFFFF